MGDLARRAIPRLIGMIHLGPLPGSPGFGGDLAGLIRSAVSDAVALGDAGFGGVMIENFGDAPFHASDVPDVTIAGMTLAVAAVCDATGAAVGVNVLRNDVKAALAIAAVTKATFVRVNVLSGTMFTDQGPIVGDAAHVIRLRDTLAPGVAIMADVFVKHAVPPAGARIEDATHDLAGRGGSDAIVVSGAATGSAPDLDRIGAVKAAAGVTPVYVGSGASAATARAMLEVADGLVVGTSIKQDGVTTNPVDPDLARKFVEVARG